MTPKQRILQFLAHNGPQDRDNFVNVAQGQSGRDYRSTLVMLKELKRKGLITVKIQLTPAGAEHLRDLPEDVIARPYRVRMCKCPYCRMEQPMRRFSITETVRAQECRNCALGFEPVMSETWLTPRDG